ncbi:putative membrane protein YdgH [Symmachiella macrocystis]|uniref:Putative membrane protein YdgH n=1 Tax=Symmachiella macrocystis TaxID=2527985 RepID=A0A5C6BLN0_9PLAN|nr:MMPL family transporter [Symmachiella macrocystis]TWU12925.1 putative membrane protein YdgH [Symmachiella macrocystis]
MSHSSFEPGRHTSAKLPLRSITEWAIRHPVWALLIAIAFGAGGVAYSGMSLGFKTKRADLIDPSAEYHRRWLNYTDSFGDQSDMVVVVEGENPDDIKQVIDDLGWHLEQDTEHFSQVLYRTDAKAPALRAKGLQFLNTDELHQIDRWLDELSRVLKGQWGLFNISSIFLGLRHQVERADPGTSNEPSPAMEPLFYQAQLFANSLDRFAAKKSVFVSPWQSMSAIGADLPESDRQELHLMNAAGTMGFLKVRAVVEENDFAGASASIQRLREVLETLRGSYPDAKIGLTGIPVLEFDEMQQSQQAMLWASGISFGGVAIFLIIGFRGVRHPLMALAMLLVAMAWSLGAATGIIGHLNILSVSFFAILIGLGIDFAIHYLARYLELRHAGEELQSALVDTATSVGPGIVTAGITTALAFYCAAFTDFLGVAELGIIAGTGILLCVVAAFIMLPALVTLGDQHTEPRQLPIPFQGRALKRLISRHPVLVVAVTLAMTGYVGVYGLNVKYDYNLLNLQAENLESVEVQSRVFEQSDGSLLFAVSVADSPEQALELKEKFLKLDGVKRVVELASQLPKTASEDTSLLVQAINVRLANLPPRNSSIAQLAGKTYEVEPDKVGLRVEELWEQLQKFPTPLSQAATNSLDKFLNRFDELTAEEQVKLIAAYEDRMTADLLSQLYEIRDASDVQPVTIDDFPETVRSRMVSDKGKWLLQIYPAYEIWDHEPLERFVQEVREVDPNVTGTPLQNYEAAQQIATSYERVAIYALITVFIVLLIDFHSIKDGLLALLPPLAGGALMMGVLGLLGVDLNPANLIVLPLVIGIGVDDGVHVVHDFRQQTANYRMSASTTNAIVLTSLTSMIGFGSMMVASHRGLYSLGLVLVVGVGACLFVSLVMLPALLTLFSRETPKSHPWRFTDEGRAMPRDRGARSREQEEALPQPDSPIDFTTTDNPNLLS